MNHNLDILETTLFIVLLAIVFYRVILQLLEHMQQAKDLIGQLALDADLDPCIHRECLRVCALQTDWQPGQRIDLTVLPLDELETRMPEVVESFAKYVWPLRDQWEPPSHVPRSQRARGSPEAYNGRASGGH